MTKYTSLRSFYERLKGFGLRSGSVCTRIRDITKSEYDIRFALERVGFVVCGTDASDTPDSVGGDGGVGVRRHFSRR